MINKHALRRRLPRHWNRRIFTTGDFEFFCALERIQVIETDLYETSGLYFETHDSKRFIFLDRGLRRTRRLWVAFHELAHAWLHAPGAHFYLNLDDKTHYEAEMVAACCLIPLHLLSAKTHGELIEEYDYPAELVDFRLQVYERHRL